MVFNLVESLVTQLISDNSRLSLKLISIDGKDGVGKSTLAIRMAKDLNGFHLELDNFLQKNKGYYVPALKMQELRAAIHNQSTKQPLIVDGLCVQKVLRIANAKPDLSIYVKRVDQFGEWIDEELFDSLGTPEDVFAKDKADLIQFRKLMPDLATSTDDDDYRESVFHEIVRYHYEYRPHITADHVVHNFLNGA